jgi:superfamily II DNA/RNA helicase
VGAIVIVPTRELAEQIFGVLGRILDAVGTLSSLLLIGGASKVADDLGKVC